MAEALQVVSNVVTVFIMGTGQPVLDRSLASSCLGGLTL